MAEPWDVRFRPLIPGRFVERLSRFHARVEVEGREALAHVANSGRLRELLVPGNAVRLSPQPRPDRRTPFDLVLARIPEGERGPGTGTWACLDARLPPRILAAAVARGVFPTLRGYRLVAAEPPLGAGRADLLLEGPGCESIVEAKSITLVRGGAGLFPDSPTVRGAGHVRDLAAVGNRRRLAAFVVQRGDARAVRVNGPADPAFATALRRAVRAGVEVLAGVCDVSPQGVRLREPVPLEWFRPGAPVVTLPDHVRPGLRLLMVGMNPGAYSAWFGMYFARPGNLLWPALRAAALVPPTTGPGDEAWVCRTLGIGFTDVVKRPTARVDQVRPEEWAEGVARLRRLLRRFRPAAVCFVGLRGARAALGGAARPGPQPGMLEGVPAFVVPATSGRQAAYGRREMVRWFRALAGWLEGGG